MPRILLIDDDEQLRKVLGELLTRQGFDVMSASHGAQGLELAAQRPPDLILCDLSMPVLDGHGVVAALRQQENLANIPFIFLTANSDHQQIRHSMNLGADDYLTKPVPLRELMDAIGARLKRREVEQERERHRIEEAVHQGAGAASAKLAETFMVKTADHKELVEIREVKCIIAYGEYSRVYWGKEKQALLRKPLKQWEEELPKNQFVRVHRQAIINIEFLERLEKLPNGQQQVRLRETAEPVAVSQRCTPMLNRKLAAINPAAIR